MCFGGASQVATTSPTELLFKINDTTRGVIEKVRCVDPLFFKMYSPASATKVSAEQFIDPIKHRYLVISLIFGQEESPKAKYKVSGNKRTMVVQLAKDGSLSLRRNDQTIEYQIKWISEEMKCLWLAVRSEFLALCQEQPAMTESIQRCMIQELVSDDALKAGIEAYCYSALSPWMTHKSGPFKNQTMKDRLLCWREASFSPMKVTSENELDETDSAPEVVIEGAAKGGRWEEDHDNEEALASSSSDGGSPPKRERKTRSSPSWCDIENDDSDLSQRW